MAPFNEIEKGTVSEKTKKTEMPPPAGHRLEPDT